MLSAPTPLGEAHDFDLFQSGNDTLDDWLRRRAHANQASGASRTYVIAEEWRVVGYYCLASGALDLADAPSSVRRNMPDPIPMAVLGRLAIDRDWQGKGLGAALLQDAVLRSSQAADIMGIRGLLVHAISGEAKAFYEHYGFQCSPNHPMTLVLSLKGKRVRALPRSLCRSPYRRAKVAVAGWCPMPESNQHSFRNSILSRARLPIPPMGLEACVISALGIYTIVFAPVNHEVCDFRRSHDFGPMRHERHRSPLGTASVQTRFRSSPPRSDRSQKRASG